jgi:hypothetical protein
MAHLSTATSNSRRRSSLGQERSRPAHDILNRSPETVIPESQPETGHTASELPRTQSNDALTACSDCRKTLSVESFPRAGDIVCINGWDDRHRADTEPAYDAEMGKYKNSSADARSRSDEARASSGRHTDDLAKMKATAEIAESDLKVRRSKQQLRTPKKR